MNGINNGNSPEHKKQKTDAVVVFCGTLVHATDECPMEILKDHAIGVQGKMIVFVCPKEELADQMKVFDVAAESIVNLDKCEFLIPGFVDTHIHAPQYAVTGTGTDLELLDWLERYAFPTEAKFSDLKFARNVYTKCVERVLGYGTTTAAYFATIHTDASLLLCDIIGEFGQRAFVGKVNMDQESPDYYVETTEESVRETKRFVAEVEKKKNPLVQACITPRFAITCSSELMTKLGDIAAEHNLPIQTHLSENVGEIEFVDGQYPDKTYAEVYDHHNLITEKSIFAHCIHVSNPELKLLHTRKAGVAHCANSNMTIRSGLMDVKNTLLHNVKCGLGTDVSGGYHPSILDSLRSAMNAANVRWLSDRSDDKHLNFKDFFKLATLGGSEVMGLDDKIGNFKVGKEFDAIYVDTKAEGAPFDLFEIDSLEDVIQKFFMLGDDRNIKEVYVAGRKVKPF